MYTICFPSASLRPFIECFWFLQTHIAPPTQLQEIIFTDARADLVFNFGSPYLRRNAAQQQAQLMRVSNVDAQRRYPVYIVQHGQVHLAGVRFRPGGLAGFVPTPMHNISGLTLGVRDIFGQPGVDLEEQLFNAADQHHAQVTLLDTFFEQRLAVDTTHALVAHVVTTIEQQQGMLAIGALSARYGYSIRNLNRLFQQVIGFSPKQYARIIRFQATLRQLMQQPAIAWADIVSGCGYYDQPHFIKEFAEFTGMRPEAYRAQLRHTGRPDPPNHVQFLQDNVEQMR